MATNFLMDDVHCTGSETDIESCPHNPIHNCGSLEGAGVKCGMPNKFKPKIKMKLDVIWYQKKIITLLYLLYARIFFTFSITINN